MMKDHQLRVINEKGLLNTNITKLHTFMVSDKFKTIDPEERERLVRQYNAMREYSLILHERICAFE